MAFFPSYSSPLGKLALVSAVAALLAMALAYDLPSGDLGAEIFWQLRLPRVLLAFMAGLVWRWRAYGCKHSFAMPWLSQAYSALVPARAWPPF